MQNRTVLHPSSYATSGYVDRRQLIFTITVRARRRVRARVRGCKTQAVRDQPRNDRVANKTRSATTRTRVRGVVSLLSWAIWPAEVAGRQGRTRPTHPTSCPAVDRRHRRRAMRCRSSSSCSATRRASAGEAGTEERSMPIASCISHRPRVTLRLQSVFAAGRIILQHSG